MRFMQPIHAQHAKENGWMQFLIICRRCSSFRWSFAVLPLGVQSPLLMRTRRQRRHASLTRVDSAPHCTPARPIPHVRTITSSCCCCKSSFPPKGVCANLTEVILLSGRGLPARRGQVTVLRKLKTSFRLLLSWWFDDEAAVSDRK